MNKLMNSSILISTVKWRFQYGSKYVKLLLQNMMSNNIYCDLIYNDFLLLFILH